MREIVVLSGSAHPVFAQQLCDALGVPLSPTEIRRFSNDCLWVQIGENCRQREVYVVQPLVPPTQEHLVELLLMLDAARGASAAQVTAVIPHYAYARSDKKDASRISIAGRLVADMLVTAGADRVLTMTLHAPQVHGFFSVPVDHLTAIGELADHFRGRDLTNTVVVSPDLGNAKTATQFSRLLGLPVAAGSKQRLSDDKVVIDAIVGDVRGKRAIVLDDEIATGGSIIELLDRLAEQNCTDVAIACTHGLFAGKAHAAAARPPERVRGRDDRHRAVPGSRLAGVHRALGGPAVRRGDLAHPRRRVDQQPVRRRRPDARTAAAAAAVRQWLSRASRVSTLELFFDLVFVFTISAGGRHRRVASVVVRRDRAGIGRTAGHLLDVRRIRLADEHVSARPARGSGSCCSRGWRHSCRLAGGAAGVRRATVSRSAIAYLMLNLVHLGGFLLRGSATFAAMLRLGGDEHRRGTADPRRRVHPPARRTGRCGSLALLIQIVPPLLSGTTPGTFTLNVEHFAERHGLMIIIVLGESLGRRSSRRAGANASAACWCSACCAGWHARRRCGGATSTVRTTPLHAALARGAGLATRLSRPGRLRRDRMCSCWAA